MSELGVPVPTSISLMRRFVKSTSVEQREAALRQASYNHFAFPADLLVLDFLSDSGTSSMTDLQWASLILGDEAYGRNRGYYALLDAIRDTFERGDRPNKLINLIRSGETDVDRLSRELYLATHQGGFVNGGEYQLMRPNAFLTPQGRCAEYLLFSTLAQVLGETDAGRQYWIPSNGHFDTTEAHIGASGFEPVNLYREGAMDRLTLAEIEGYNPFKGNMDCARLEAFVQEKGRSRIPLVYLTITNNTVAGQPVSVANIKQVSAIAAKYGIPLFFDACRFAENAYFVKRYEPGYQDRSIQSIVQEMFSYADGFTISFKKDGMANIGGGLFFRDQGIFHQRFSVHEDIGARLKEKQILTFGNDSYGGLSGHDIMTIAAGLYEVVAEPYLQSRIGQTHYFARRLAEKNIPVVLPAGGHAIYIDMNHFFRATTNGMGDFRGLGLIIELIRRYGIRASEVGPYSFEWDQKSEEQRRGILNLVRFAIPRNLYGNEHIDYAVAALIELYENEHVIPRMKITRGASLRLRHFQAGLEPEYETVPA
ncbi:MAG: tryptophanase [Caldilineaceae bacterium]